MSNDANLINAHIQPHCVSSTVHSAHTTETTVWGQLMLRIQVFWVTKQLLAFQWITVLSFFFHSLALKIKTLQSFETWSLLTSWHGVTPPSRAMVKNVWSSTSTPPMPSWCAQGQCTSNESTPTANLNPWLTAFINLSKVLSIKYVSEFGEF